MAGDFNKPAGASARTGFMQEIRDLVKDVGRMLNPDTATANIPTGAIRRNPTTKKFEEWNGTAWVDLPLTGQLVGNATVIKSAYVTGGTATAYTVTIPEVTTLVSGDTYFVKAHTANTTTTPTLAVSGQAAKTIKKEGGVALVIGDIPINHEAVLRYNGTDIILLNPAVPTTAGTATTASQPNITTASNLTTIGVLVAGTVPLARMGTVVASGTTGSISAGAILEIPLEDVAAEHRYYQYSAYVVSGTNDDLAYGAHVSGDETVTPEKIHVFITRQSGAQEDTLAIVNGTSEASTVAYKIYKLTET